MNLDRIFKNSKTVQLIDKELSLGTLSHAYLLVSEDVAFSENIVIHFAKKILGECNDCGFCSSCIKIDAKSHPDFDYYPKNADGKILVPNIIELIDKLYYKPIESKSKVIAICGVENMADVAQNKLLKVLEEPPQNTYFFLTVRSKEQALSTIRSRCEVLYPEKINADLLKDVVSKDNIQGFELDSIIESSDGNLTRLLEEINKTDKTNYYKLAYTIVKILNNTKDMLDCIKLFKGIDEKKLLLFMNQLYGDLLQLKNDNIENIIGKSYIEDLKLIVDKFSNMCLIESINIINDASNKLKYNCNRNMLIDSLLMKLLEVKYNCL